MTVTPGDNGPCWLLTGGAGYIGAHIVRAFGEHGLRVVVLDDLSAGIRDNVPADVPFVEARLQDEDAVRSTIREHGVTGVLQLAAKKAVGESVEKPILYWDENVGGFARLLDVCTAGGCRALPVLLQRGRLRQPPGGVRHRGDARPPR